MYLVCVCEREKNLQEPVTLFSLYFVGLPCGSQGTMNLGTNSGLSELVLTFHLWVLGIKFRLSALTGSSYTNRGILLKP